MIKHYGGVEFIIWLSSETPKENQFTYFYEPVSVEIARWDGESSFAVLFEQADKALYRGKEAGRSCVVIY